MPIERAAWISDELVVNFKIEDLLVKAFERTSYGYMDSRAFWTRTIADPISAPHIWVPKLTLPQAAMAGVAAAVIKNPIVTRRFWAGWR